EGPPGDRRRRGGFGALRAHLLSQWLRNRIALAGSRRSPGTRARRRHAQSRCSRGSAHQPDFRQGAPRQGSLAVPAADDRSGRAHSVAQVRELLCGQRFMTLLLTNAEVEQALTYADALIATEAILRELAEGRAVNRPRTQTYMPVESRDNPGFRYRFKSQEGGGVGSGVWALRITSDMAGFSYTAGVKR